MKINLLSDLHLEFGKEDFDIGNGDVLILAGDICVIDDIVAEWILEKDDEEREDNVFLSFFRKCIRNYNKVFYIMGNHEHYGWDYKISEMWLLTLRYLKFSRFINELYIIKTTFRSPYSY